MSTNCNNWWALHLPKYFHWTTYANFVLLLIFYHVLLLQYYWTKLGVGGTKSSSSNAADIDDESSVHEEVYFLYKIFL